MYKILWCLLFSILQQGTSFSITHPLHRISSSLVSRTMISSAKVAIEAVPAGGAAADSSPRVPLSTSLVQQVLQSVVEPKAGEQQPCPLDSIGLSLQLVQNDSLKTAAEMKTPWYFAMDLIDTTKTVDDPERVVGKVSFYIAYSSWDGRILYLDQFQFPAANPETEQRILQTLAKVALQLDCVRLTWRHTSTPEWYKTAPHHPEDMEILTLSMDEAAMEKFLSPSPLAQLEPIPETTFGSSLVEQAFEATLGKLNDAQSTDSGSKNFRLRRVQQQDLSTMAGLVQGLADYVHESDHVHLGPDDYVQDGFELEDPLWYSIIVDRKSSDSDEWIPCGFAFFYIGYIEGQGRFLYLEDLFVEVEQRGSGAGQQAMQALAGLCRALQCTRFYWQALEWNKVGLGFYDKIGAKIHQGEQSSRYAGNALKQLADNGVN
eukprot:Nitzschia sp. Nitz4//scaffold146_size56529//20893//22289//NITZ4_006575-RA/size56529-processed-gene-0.61-mRNA-1//-1//CDS//3329536632//2176//frame0